MAIQATIVQSYERIAKLPKNRMLRKPILEDKNNNVKVERPLRQGDNLNTLEDEPTTEFVSPAQSLDQMQIKGLREIASQQ